jgi:hypothetical protein
MATLRRKKEVLYVAFDVEAAGPRLGVDSTLSVGACAVVHEALGYDEYLARGLVFYTELKPMAPGFDPKAMRVGCSQLVALSERRHESAHFDPTSRCFDPRAVLEHLAASGERPDAAAARFRTWLKSLAAGCAVIPLTDTVFFDSGHVNLWLGPRGGSPLGHSGRDLKSIYIGYAGRNTARLRDIRVPRNRKPHRADYDAVELAQKAGVLLFEKMGW